MSRSYIFAKLNKVLLKKEITVFDGRIIQNILNSKFV
jgi:hypothetical protein